MASRSTGQQNVGRRLTAEANHELEASQLALKVAEAGLDKKAQQVEIIDVRGKVDYADFVVVMSGRSERQVSAIAKGVVETVKKNHGVACQSMEGVQQGQWVLVDFCDVIVHVFHRDMRGYYDLEALWLDAERIPVEDPAADEPEGNDWS